MQWVGMDGFPKFSSLLVLINKLSLEVSSYLMNDYWPTFLSQCPSFSHDFLNIFQFKIMPQPLIFLGY